MSKSRASRTAVGCRGAARLPSKNPAEGYEIPDAGASPSRPAVDNRRLCDRLSVDGTADKTISQPGTLLSGSLDPRPPSQPDRKWHMARVSYIEEKDHPELAELIGVLRSGRRGVLINVYKLLLHSPPLAEAWFNLIGTARWKTELDGRLREIAIIRVGYLNRVAYVVKQHVPLLAIPEGLTMAECDALADWRTSKYFNARERAALAYTDAMTTEIRVAGCRVQRPQTAFQRAPDRRIDRADRDLQHAHPRVPGARRSTRTASHLKPDPAAPCRHRSSSSRTTVSCASCRSCSIPTRARERVRGLRRFLRPRRSRFRRLVRAHAHATAPGSIRPRCASSTPRTSCAPTLPIARALIVEGLAVGAQRARRRAPPQGGAEIRRRLAPHRHRRLRGARHPGAYHAPPRQRRLRRARDHADADAVAARQRIARPHQRRAPRRDRLSLQAVRPPPHAQLQLGPRAAACEFCTTTRSASSASARSAANSRCAPRRSACACFTPSAIACPRPRSSNSTPAIGRWTHMLAESDWVVPLVPGVPARAT